MPKTLFISYSHADAEHLARLRIHLKPLERTGLVSPWFDGYIIAGDQIDDRVREALEKAQIIVLLLSPDFLASDYCHDVEMTRAVERHERGEARVIPVTVRQSQWKQTPLSRLRATPTDGRPIMSPAWPDKDEAWHIVAEDIARAAASRPSAPHTGAAPIRDEVDLAVTPAATPLSRPRLSLPRVITDQDKDEHRLAAFNVIADAFAQALEQPGGGLSGRFTRLDAQRFTATVYSEGKKAAGCTVWTGGGHFGHHAICYYGSDSGETNSMNEWLDVEEHEGALVLKASMAAAFGRDAPLSPEAAAEFLWEKFTSSLR